MQRPLPRSSAIVPLQDEGTRWDEIAAEATDVAAELAECPKEADAVLNKTTKMYLDIAGLHVSVLYSDTGDGGSRRETLLARQS